MHMIPAMTRVFAGSLFLFTGAVYPQNTNQPASKPQHPEKVTLTECEGGDNCGTWTFLWTNGKGTGKWRTGEEAVLEMNAPAENKVVVLRTDVTGANEGLTARYEGTLVNGQLGGSVEYVYQGQRISGFWNARVGTSEASLPPVVHFCAAGCSTGRGGTMVLQNGRYVGPGSDGSDGFWTVEKFTRESVIIHRTDFGSYPGQAVLTGQISPDGSSIVNGTITWTKHDCPGCALSSTPFKLAWGSALNTVPGGSNGPLQQTQSSQLGIDGSKIVNDLVTWSIEEYIKSLLSGSQQ